ncbi:MAG: prepilin peptidase [Bulleidia sp.]
MVRVVITGIVCGLCMHFMVGRFVKERRWKSVCIVTVLSVVQYVLKGNCDVILIGILYGISVIDAKKQVIPDVLSAALIGNALIHGRFHVLSSVVIVGLVWLCAQVMKRVSKEEVIGEGDYVLLAGCGLYLGLYASFVHLFVSACLTLLLMIGRRENRMGFGPGICIALYLIECIQ